MSRKVDMFANKCVWSIKGTTAVGTNLVALPEDRRGSYVIVIRAYC